MKVVWSQVARNDLEAIGQWIAADNPAAALALVRRIRQSAVTLARSPHIGRPGRVPDTRELVIAGTLIIVPYRVHVDRVEILAVFHSARKWPNIL